VRALAVAGLVIAFAALALLRGTGRFEGYVADAGGTKRHVLRVGDTVRLRFVDRDRLDTPYEIVYVRATDRRVLRFQDRTSGRGHADVVEAIDPGPPSRVSVRWLVAGRTRARWVFLIRPRKPAR
jgi:hypothetical protein